MLAWLLHRWRHSALLSCAVQLVVAQSLLAWLLQLLRNTPVLPA